MGVVGRLAPVAMALVLGVPMGALADKDALMEGKRLFHQVEYRRAVAALSRALAGRLTRTQRIQATLLMAKAQHALDRPGDAMAAFRSLLRLAPNHRLSASREPPALLELFERVRASVAPVQRHAPPTIAHRPVRRALAGSLLRIVARVANHRPGFHTRVYYRRIGQLRYENQEMTGIGGGVFSAALDLKHVAGSAQEYLLEYYLAVRGGLGERLARVGSPEHPLQIRVTASLATAPIRVGVSKAAPWYKRHWWIWVALGAVVVGGAVAGTIAAR